MLRSKDNSSAQDWHWFSRLKRKYGLRIIVQDMCGWSIWCYSRICGGEWNEYGSQIKVNYRWALGRDGGGVGQEQWKGRDLATYSDHNRSSERKEKKKTIKHLVHFITAVNRILIKILKCFSTANTGWNVSIYCPLNPTISAEMLIINVFL